MQPTEPGAEVINANALDLPLPDESVDLIVTSPPYFALRSYRDGDEHYDGQIGSEPTPQEFLEALWAATREMRRVLKPSGSIWVNLGDKYAGSGGHNNAGVSRNGTSGSTPTGGKAKLESLHHSDDDIRAARRNAPDRYNQNSGGIPAKSLMGLPWRYAIGCVDQLGLILRRDLIWEKVNSLPESVNDRCRTSHEYWFHFTKQGRYFAAIDEIRESRWTSTNGLCPTCGLPTGAGNGRGGKTDGDTARQLPSADEARTGRTESPTSSSSAPSLTDSRSTTSAVMSDASTLPTLSPSPGERTSSAAANPCKLTASTAIASSTPTSTGAPGATPESAAPVTRNVCGCGTLGRLPGSVWAVPSEPLIIPQAAKDAYNLPDHFAAFPSEWPRRIILGWSPSGICTACGEGRRPVVEKERTLRGDLALKANDKDNNPNAGGIRVGAHMVETSATITGYACACTPYTDHPGTGQRHPNTPPEGRHGNTEAKATVGTVGGKPTVGPWREYHFADWTPHPTRPAVVLDPFGGTGTVAMVARALGRYGVSVDLSADYCRLAEWRIFQSGHADNLVRKAIESGAMDASQVPAETLERARPKNAPQPTSLFDS